MSEDSVFYGHEKVAPETKNSRVEDLFGRVAKSYDVMNDVMSMGLHRSFVRSDRGLTGGIWIWRAAPATSRFAFARKPDRVRRLRSRI